MESVKERLDRIEAAHQLETTLDAAMQQAKEEDEDRWMEKFIGKLFVCIDKVLVKHTGKGKRNGT
jgi:hypothetical protein